MVVAEVIPLIIVKLLSVIKSMALFSLAYLIPAYPIVNTQLN
jgi:hypothetical protein